MLDRARKAYAGIPLRPMEWLFVSTLAEDRGRVVPYERLITAMYGGEYRTGRINLRVVANHVRRKLDGIAKIETHPTVGYRLVSVAMQPCGRCQGSGFVEVGA